MLPAHRLLYRDVLGGVLAGDDLREASDYVLEIIIHGDKCPQSTFVEIYLDYLEAH